MNVGWNYLSLLVDGAVNLAVLAYVVRTVPQLELGILWLALAVGELFILLDIGLFGLLARGYLEEQARADGEPMQLVGSAVIAASALGLLAAVATTVVGALITLHSGISHAPGSLRDFPFIVGATGLYVALMFPGEALYRVYSAEGRFRLLSTVNVVLALLRGTLSVVLVQVGLGATGIIVAVCGVTALRLALLISPALLRRAGMSPLVFRWDWARLRSIWRQGPWALVDNIAHHITFGLNTLIIFVLISPGAVVLYGVAARLPNYSNLAVEKAVAVALPQIAERHVVGAVDESAQLFVVLLRYTFAAVLPLVVIGSIVAAPLLALWLSPTFVVAAPTLRWLLAGTLGISVAVPCITALYAIGEVASSAKLAVVEAATNVVLTIILIGPFGIAGAASATAIAHLATSIVGLLPTVCRRLHLPIMHLARYVTRGVGIPLTCALGLLAIAWSGTGASDYGYRVAGGTVAGIAYFTILWLHWLPFGKPVPMPSPL